VIKFLVSALLVINPSYKPVQRIEAAIVTLQPSVDTQIAKQLARSIYYWCGRYGLDPITTVALGFQESSLTPGRVSGTGDIGVFQLSPRTIKAYNLDAVRLNYDLDYSVYAFAYVMDDKLRVCGSRKAVGCFHSFTPELRESYQALILKHRQRIAH
jgi:hypothetical protein